MKEEIIVKVCEKCGIVNTERAQECESCGAELGAPVKNSEANKLSKQIAKRNERTKKAIAAEKFGGSDEDPIDIPVTPTRICIGVVGCFVAVCEMVLMALCGRLFPEYADEMFIVGLGVLVLQAIAVLHCFLPGKMWMIAHCIDHLFYKDIPRPSDTGLKFQIFSCVLLILMGIAFIVLQLLVLCGVL